jgi:cytochrome d ubiquinol oxidase subunit II
VTEIGRQPWLVSGILLTADAAGGATGAELGASLTAYVAVYAVLLLSYMVTLTHLAGKAAPERPRMSIDLPLVFAALMGAGDPRLRGARRLRPRRRHADARRRARGARRHDRLDRPFWDANETWLVLGVGLLLVAFPVAHGIVLGALYLPVAAMLVGLMLRGVAFELRIKAEGWHRELWNWLFCAGSFLAAFSQGLMLGRYITGFEPGFGAGFRALVGVALCGGYMLLGATWLVLRTEGELRDKSAPGRAGASPGSRSASRWSASPRRSRARRCASVVRLPAHAGLMLLPLATLGAGCWSWLTLDKSDWKPFAGAVAIYVLAFAGLAYSLFPYVVMDSLTIWDAAAHPSALDLHARSAR